MHSDNIFVIAEAGVNHNGSLDHALKLVDVAVDAGCDAIKFQTFCAKKLASANASKALYQLRDNTSKSQQEMLSELELSTKDYFILKQKCDFFGIEFMSTAFDVDSLQFLINDIEIQRIKIPSGEILSGPLLLAAARSGLPVILSTGMSTMEDIFYAISIFAWADDHENGIPGNCNELKPYTDPKVWSSQLKERLVLLQCVSQYPAEPIYMNLRAMDYMRELTGIQVGLSDHTQGIAVAIAAAGRDASIIEKHFTLSHYLPGPDHKASLEPQALIEMVRSLRIVSEALGRKYKFPQPPEIEVRKVARGSLTALEKINLNQHFTEHNLSIKRPGIGIPGSEYWDYLNNKIAQRVYVKDEIIEREKASI